MLSVGAHGCISVAANVEPERTCAMVGAAVAGDYERAADSTTNSGRCSAASSSRPTPSR